ncbi:hypothetical protein CRG98_039350 [Punica granatum]|uniref:Uncharacterized protein n=1 Tax=Punica granatum TaxID=22663 RepID=A0A2I0I8D2_PUNGR|nr:hypothetical protein CRG98_039350 [Punica granatum]
MGTLSCSVSASNFPEKKHTPIPSISASSLHKLSSLKVPKSSPTICLRTLASKRDYTGGGAPDEEKRPPADGLPPPNGFGLGAVPENSFSSSQDDLDHQQSIVRSVNDRFERGRPLSVPYGSGAAGGTRAGLFRTPISGGVQSATPAHGLPPPALAVRNLMEQARFAHLCTVMSQIHHRREGYPFVYLVGKGRQ